MMIKFPYFTSFYLNINGQALCLFSSLLACNHLKFVCDDQLFGSEEYRRRTEEMLKEIQYDFSKSLSIKEYVSNMFGVPWNQEMEYISRAFSLYVVDNLGWTKDQIKKFLQCKNYPEYKRLYNEKFRKFFIKQILLTRGDVLTRKQLDNRIIRTTRDLDKLNNANANMLEYRMECKKNLEAYDIMLKFMKHYKMDSIDLFALYNGQKLRAYCPKGKSYLEDDIDRVYFSNKEFSISDQDIITRC